MVCVLKKNTLILYISHHSVEMEDKNRTKMVKVTGTLWQNWLMRVGERYVHQCTPYNVNMFATFQNKQKEQHMV